MSIPDPSAVDWVPLWSLSTPGGTGLPADTVVAAATRIISNLLAQGDANPAWRIFGSGKMEWGAGGATAVDTSLYRAGANYLATNGLYVDAASVGYKIYFGGAGDTNLYRSAAGVLKTDGEFQANILTALGTASAWGLRTRRTTDANWRWGTDVAGMHWWGDGTAAVDTNLYRSAAGVLKTDGYLTAGLNVVANYGAATQVFIGGSPAQIGFGSANDVQLYRSAAGTLASDGHFTAGGRVTARLAGAAQVQFGDLGPASESGMRFGSAGDTNLYRVAAAVLKTDGALATGSYGTSLPASPVDGQEYTLVDSVTNPIYEWRFRYNGQSTGTYKWEFVGGAPAEVGSGTDYTVPTGWSMMPDPLFTVPRAGYYQVESYVDWVQNGANVLDAWQSPGTTGAQIAGSAQRIGASLNDGLPPCRVSGTWSSGGQIRHWAYAGATGLVMKRRLLIVLPVKVA